MMACYESEFLSFMHVSVERQIREMYNYPKEQSIQQFFRDSPDLSLGICIALEDKVKIAVAIFKKAIDKADQCIAEKDRTIERLTQHIADVTREKDSRISDKDELLQEKKMRLIEKEDTIQQTRKEKEERVEEIKQIIKEKDYLIQEMKSRSEAEKSLLSMMLERANTETLKLSQSLSIRGMIEKIEYQYSDKRRTGGTEISRQAVWIEILHNNETLKLALTKHCSEKSMRSKVDAVATTISQIYRQISDEIHHAGYDEIPIQKSKFKGMQLDLLRDLCAIMHFAIREI